MSFGDRERRGAVCRGQGGEPVGTEILGQYFDDLRVVVYHQNGRHRVSDRRALTRLSISPEQPDWPQAAPFTGRPGPSRPRGPARPSDEAPLFSSLLPVAEVAEKAVDALVDQILEPGEPVAA